MVEEILEAFASRMGNATSHAQPGIGLTPTAARPRYGLKVGTRPSAQLAATNIGTSDETSIASATNWGHQLDAVLYIFAASEKALWGYLDALVTLHEEYDTLIASSTEVEIQWGQAVSPEPFEEAPETHYQIQQPVTFVWG